MALVESAGRKCAFLVAAASALGLENVEVVNARAEAWPVLSAVAEWIESRIEETPSEPTMLVTVRGLGYRFNA